jgi:hypothetical protein
MATSFLELEAAPSVTAEQLVATLKHYAEGGWAIIGDVVIGLLTRVRLTDRERLWLLRHARDGAVAHEARRSPKEAKEYRKVCDFLMRSQP